jgi:hypothetical protein
MDCRALGHPLTRQNGLAILPLLCSAGLEALAGGYGPLSACIAVGPGAAGRLSRHHSHRVDFDRTGCVCLYRAVPASTTPRVAA